MEHHPLEAAHSLSLYSISYSASLETFAKWIHVYFFFFFFFSLPCCPFTTTSLVLEKRERAFFIAILYFAIGECDYIRLCVRLCAMGERDRERKRESRSINYSNAKTSSRAFDYWLFFSILLQSAFTINGSSIYQYLVGLFVKEAVERECVFRSVKSPCMQYPTRPSVRTVGYRH